VNDLASGRPALPRHPREITAEWLTAALRHSGLDVGVRVIQRMPIGEGAGLMATTERVEVDYEHGEGPAVVILKRPSDNEGNRAVANAFHLYQREVLFYMGAAHRSAAYTAKVHYADIDGDDFILLLEDLSAYDLGDQAEGCSAEDAMAGMVWLGRHHATFWGNVDDGSLDFLPHVSPSYSSEAIMQGAAFGWDPMVQIFGDVLPVPIKELKERYLAALPRILDAMAKRPITVVHGDFRLDNLFFGRSEGQEPLIAIDWQGALRGRPAQDLGYFMGGNLPIEVRRAHERELIERWHGELVANGVTGYTLDDAWYEYRLGVLYVWNLAVIISGTLDMSNDRARRWISEMLRRSVAAMEDLDLLDLLSEIEAQQ